MYRAKGIYLNRAMISRISLPNASRVRFPMPGIASSSFSLPGILLVSARIVRLFMMVYCGNLS